MNERATDPAHSGARAALLSAFPQVRYTGDLIGGVGDQAIFDDPGLFDEECDLVEAVKGRTWGEIAVGYLRDNPDTFLLLGDDAFAALFPAWVAASIEDETVAEFLFYAFCVDCHDGGDDRFRRRVSRYSPAQLQAIADVLRQSSLANDERFAETYIVPALHFLQARIDECTQ